MKAQHLRLSIQVLMAIVGAKTIPGASWRHVLKQLMKDCPASVPGWAILAGK
jgi:hypothetical protein